MFKVVGAENPRAKVLAEALSEERKGLQKQGLLPSWYTTAAWKMFKSKYAYPADGGTLHSRHETIAKTLAKHLPEQYQAEYEEKFFNELWDGILSPSSPALSNTGTDRGMSVACSGQYIGNSVWSFYTGVRETAMLSKHAFGTSGEFSDIQPRNTGFSGNGQANGAREVIEDFFTSASKIAQGGNRRGSFAAYLDIEHDDFYECLDSLRTHSNGKNYGWTIRDSFIVRLLDGDAEAHKRWTDALHVKMLTGKGYLFFPDKANRHRPQMYKDLGLDIKASNLCCVAADQRVVTAEGILTVAELYKRGTVNTVMGLEGANQASEMFLPRPNAPMVQVETAEGYRHKVTPDHRIWKKGEGWVEAQHLVAGDHILIQQGEGLFGKQDKPELALIAGLVAGDGTYTEHSVCIDLWHDKTISHVDAIENVVANLLAGNDELCTTSTNSPKFVGTEVKLRLSSAPLARLLANEGFTKETKLVVPEFVWQGTKETVSEYLRGLYLTDGHLQTGKQQACTMVLASNNKDFLQDIQVLWANFGVKSSICLQSLGGDRDFGAERGGVYTTKPVYRLLITSIQGCQIAHEATKLGEFRTGKTADEFNERLRKKGYKQKLYATFTGLTELPNEDAYCLTVDSESHAWTVNGLITHNTEIMLHSSELLTYSCILASLNMAHWDKIPERESVFIATVFLDCLCSEFIEKAEGKRGLDKVRNFTIKGRAVGLGVLGFATYLQEKRIPYESLDAMYLNTRIFKHLHDESLRASQWLAEVFGEPEWCVGYGVRNTHRTAIAPTKSTSNLMGGVEESVFPSVAMVYEASSSVGGLPRINAVLYELMKERGVYNQKTLDDIINHAGSVQHVDWLDAHEKAVFRTAFEIDQEVVYRYAKARQKYLCQGQSLNLWFAEEGSETKIADLMTRIILDEDILSQYYIYSKSGVVVMDECLPCSA